MLTAILFASSLHFAPTVSAPELGAPSAATAGVTTVQGDNGDVETFTESKTKVKFKALIPADRGVGRVDLSGMHVRTKTIFGVKVYAYGLYVDPYGAQESLARFKSKSTDELRGSVDFYDTLLDDNFTKTMRLVFVRNVKGSDVRDAFDGSIKPRLKDAEKKRDWPKATEQLATFKTFFDATKLKKKGEIILTWHPGGRLTTIVNGEKKPEIQSRALCWAIFDTYLGRKPIHEKGKLRLISRIPEILATELPPRALPKEERPAEPVGSGGR